MTTREVLLYASDNPYDPSTIASTWVTGYLQWYNPHGPGQLGPKPRHHQEPDVALLREQPGDLEMSRRPVAMSWSTARTCRASAACP